MTDRKSLDDTTSNDLDQLYDELAQLREAHAEEKTTSARRKRLLDQRRPELERAEAANERVRALTDQWIKAGPPPLGTSVSRWWDRRLAELNTALDEPKDQT